MSEIVTLETEKTYPAGWHVFLNADDAHFWNTKFYSIRKVQMKDIQCYGRQEYGGSEMLVVVCKYIKILPLKKKK